MFVQTPLNPAGYAPGPQNCRRRLAGLHVVAFVCFMLRQAALLAAGA
jgi:hypothetical protein